VSSSTQPIADFANAVTMMARHHGVGVLAAPGLLVLRWDHPPMPVQHAPRAPTTTSEPAPNPTKTAAPERLCVSIPEAEVLLGVKRSTIYRLIGAGQLAALRIAGRRVIQMAEIRRFLAER
jgi:excisionase family DNA binding protein